MVMILKLDLHTEGLVLFSLYTQYTQWKSTVLESVRKAFSRQWDGDVLASQLWARAQAVKECVIIENEKLALCPPPLAKTLISTV